MPDRHPEAVALPRRAAHAPYATIDAAARADAIAHHAATPGASA